MNSRYNLKKINTKTSIYFRSTESNELDNIKTLLDEKFDTYLDNEVVNSYNSFKNVTDYIYRIVKETEFLCKGLNPDYISDSFDNVDALVVISSLKDILPNGNIFGFALINFDERFNSIYIDVICSHIGIKGVGDILINAIQDISRSLVMTEINLKSVKSAIPFYKKYGFLKDDESCDDMCLMRKSLNKKQGGKKGKTNKKKRKKVIKTRKQYLIMKL
jgi:predicted GNAT family N-acyltransferase